MSEGRCVFCDIAGGAAGAFVVYENPHAVAFLDRHPINAGHLLVVPRLHAASFYELDESSFVELMLVVRRMASLLEAAYRPRKVGMLAAGFDVAHAHVHVLPMYDYHDITSKVILEGRRPDPPAEELRATAERLRQGLGVEGERPMVVAETERLILRRFTPEDAADNYRIYADPDNMRFMGRGPDSVESERFNIRRHIANYYDRHGFGLWAVVLKEDGRLIGRCGLLYQQVEGAQEVEVSYLIDRHYQGRGLATEAARKVVELGFGRYKFPRLVALIKPENVASVRVAEKVGMEYERDVDFKDFGRVAVYTLARKKVGAN